METKYRNRIVDNILDLKLNTFGAVLLTGPKGCGKTTTAKQKAKSMIAFQDEDNREQYIETAENVPSKLLQGKKPILFDEWQDAPKIWGAIRKSIDDNGEIGFYILTGSSSQFVNTPHTGTGRISTLEMYPMSLYESGESTGEISLKALFDNEYNLEDIPESPFSIDDLIFAICRGGWPGSLRQRSDIYKLEIAKDLFHQIYTVDISNVDNTKRNPLLGELILRSYARNICTLSEQSTILHDINANYPLSDDTLRDYLNVLRKLYIVDDVNAWCPSIRSKTAIRSKAKRNLIDPSLAVASLNLSPSYFNTDFKTLGFLFESLCIRDLKIYSSALRGRVSYYHDRYGLESDAVLHLPDGRYALIEIKLNPNAVEQGAKNLNTIEALVKEHNKEETQCPLRMPDLKIVLTSKGYAYRRNDNILVIPITQLKD